jgi:hypothetical protein
MSEATVSNQPFADDAVGGHLGSAELTPKGITMTTATFHYRRPWLPALTLLLSAAAVLVAVIALAMAPNDNSDAIRQSQLGRVVSPVPASVPARTQTAPVVNAHHDRSLDPIIECGRRLPAKC